eukprot:350561-Chlamydomonas_euryale.AAC.10
MRCGTIFQFAFPIGSCSSEALQVLPRKLCQSFARLHMRAFASTAIQAWFDWRRVLLPDKGMFGMPTA